MRMQQRRSSSPGRGSNGKVDPTPSLSPPHALRARLSGCITAPSAVAAVTTTTAPVAAASGAELQMQGLRHRFAAADTDNDGYISALECAASLTSAGYATTVNEV